MHPIFEPCVEASHCGRPILHAGPAVRADEVPETSDTGGFLQEVFVDVFAEYNLVGHGSGRVEIDLQFSRAFGPAGALDAQLTTGESLEIGRVADDALPGAAYGSIRFHQCPIGVPLAIFLPGAAAQIHTAILRILTPLTKALVFTTRRRFHRA